MGEVARIDQHLVPPERPAEERLPSHRHCLRQGAHRRLRRPRRPCQPLDGYQPPPRPQPFRDSDESGVRWGGSLALRHAYPPVVRLAQRSAM